MLPAAPVLLCVITLYGMLPRHLLVSVTLYDTGALAAGTCHVVPAMNSV
jgi:hypothetical protein